MSVTGLLLGLLSGQSIRYTVGASLAVMSMDSLAGFAGYVGGIDID